MKKDKDALIVVDAWKKIWSHDIKAYPFLEKETKTFGTWLDHMFSQIRRSPSAPDIIHCGGGGYNDPPGHNLMDEIDMSQDIICPYIKDIKDEYNNYYFCGFHMNICLPRKITELEQKLDILKDLGEETPGYIGIVMNLSMIYPKDSFSFSYRKTLNRYKMFYYTHAAGFEKISL